MEIIERTPNYPSDPPPQINLHILVEACDEDDARELFEENRFSFGRWLNYYAIDCVVPEEEFIGLSVDCTHWEHYHEDALEQYLRECDEL